MQEPIRPDWLIRQANELAGRQGGPGKPRTADLRRAVSAAYYALFHATSICTAEWLLPNGGEEERYFLVRRFNHQSVKAIYERIAAPKANSQPHLQLILDAMSRNPDAAEMAEAYVDLWNARTKADYDHLADFSRKEVLQLIDRSERAIETLRTMPDHHPVDSERLFACLAMTPAGRR